MVVYDEGITLTAAMRVLAGQVPHRDFYFIYGPAQPYLIAGLFRIFGPSILLTRILDFAVQSALAVTIYAVTRRYCSWLIAACTTIVCVLWQFGLDSHSSATTPVSLLLILTTALVAAVFTREPSFRRMLFAGIMVGVTALFRYDVGAALVAIHLIMIATAVFLQSRPHSSRSRAALSLMGGYLLGFVLVMLPATLAYLSVAPWHDVYFDVVGFPSKYYHAARALPFPRIHFKTLQDLGVYLPPLILVLCVAPVFRLLRSARSRAATTRVPFWISFLFSFALVAAVMYVKGTVRVGLGEAYLSIVPSLLLIAVLFEHRASFGRIARDLIIVAAALSCVAALWSALHELRTLRLNKSSALARLISPRTQIPLPPDTGWCEDHNPLTRGFCFAPDADHIEAIEFLEAHTTPTDTLYVGLPHHDRIFINDNITYFATQRLPATKWSHFDPDLQNSVPIQNQMVQDLERNHPPYVVLDSEFDQAQEPNDSSKSTGVHLLDLYIQQHYRPIRLFGEMSVWQRVS